jgi:phospholipase/lecithinase/hemolysin
LLVACGGGTTQEQVFTPGRVIAFGDEASVLTSTGRKYSINGLAAGGAIDCAVNPIWIQTVASTYSFGFPQCSPTGSTSTNASTRAAPGARIADLRTQIDAEVAAGGLRNNDLVLMLAGANDVLELYAQFPARTEAALIEDARSRGDRYAEQIKRAVDAGARVIVSTVPDIGLSPYAQAQKAAFTDTDRAALISRLVAAVNARMRVGLSLNNINDGRLVGLVLADEMIESMSRVPGAFGLTNVIAGICTTALPDCTTATVETGGTADSHLWADSTRMSAPGHSRLGLLAQQRALNNPF